MTHVRWGFTVEPKGATPRLFTQVHGNTVLELEAPPAGEPPEADGAFTYRKGLPLHAFSADCIPVIFHTSDPDGPVGVVHSGWRGTMKRIVPAMLERLRPWPVHVAVGPCIGPCCFEVREDFIEAFRRADNPVDSWLSRREGKIFCDLPRFLVETQLGDIPRDRLDLSNVRCTHCSRPELPSFRRTKGTDPHIKAWVVKG